MLLLCTAPPMERMMWCRPRSVQWWSDVWSGRYGEAWWKENLRMSRDTFNVLCQDLRPHIERQETRLRMPIGVEKRVAVTIWKLATNVEYWKFRHSSVWDTPQETLHGYEYY